MPLQRTVLLTVSFLLVLFALGTLTYKQRQIQEIDQQIEELEDKKRGFEARALSHEDYAERLQFEHDAYLETRRHIELAEENRQKAAFIQKQIDELQAKRKRLLGLELREAPSLHGEYFY